MTDARPDCPLCGSQESDLFHRTADREFWRCGECRLTFVPVAQHPSREDELARYREHQNDPADPGYRAYLDQVVRHLAPKLAAGAAGLDYGSGPGPTLSVMLEENGFRMRIYDPFFAPDPRVLSEPYDFITCTETVEHFARPATEFSALNRLLRPGGWLGVMTQRLEDDASFPAWWYHRDVTHIAFYRPETMRWIATRYGWSVELPEPNVTLFQRGGADRC